MSCVKTEGAQPAEKGRNGLDFNPYEIMEPRLPGKTPKDRQNGALVKTQNIEPEGVYRPDYNILTPNMRSPEYVQMSTAAAITLGVTTGRMYRCSCTRCLNLLLTYPEGCRANCAYCGLARHREAERNYADRNFIRVDWPAVPMEVVVDKVASDGENSPFHRMCISMITHPRSDADTVVGAEKMDGPDRSGPDPGVHPVEPDDDGAHGRPAAEGPGGRHIHGRAGCGNPCAVRPDPRQGRAISA